MLSNAYFLAKFRFDTAENEPAKNLQTIANFASFASNIGCRPRQRRTAAGAQLTGWTPDNTVLGDHHDAELLPS